eukprot:SAG31_NODE_39161_length_290_cov_1.078534_2_plen_28_part_01
MEFVLVLNLNLVHFTSSLIGVYIGSSYA